MARKARTPAPKPETASKYALTLTLDAHQARRFKAACAFWGRDASDVAGQWINEKLEGFRVGYSAPKGAPGESAEPDAPAPGELAGPQLARTG